MNRTNFERFLEPDEPQVFGSIGKETKSMKVMNTWRRSWA